MNCWGLAHSEGYITIDMLERSDTKTLYEATAGAGFELVNESRYPVFSMDTLHFIYWFYCDFMVHFNQLLNVFEVDKQTYDKTYTVL